MFGPIVRTYKIAAISRDLDPNTLMKLTAQGDSQVLLTDANRRTRAQQALWDLIEGDRELKPILEKYQVKREDLAVIFKNLVQCGSGQWINEQLICVSAFVHPATLDFLLRHKNEIPLSRVALRLVKYFKNEEEGDIPE